MNETEIKTVELIINNEKAAKKLTELERQMDIIAQKKEQAMRMGDWDGVKNATREAKKLERQMEGVRSRA